MHWSTQPKDMKKMRQSTHTSTLTRKSSNTHASSGDILSMDEATKLLSLAASLPLDLAINSRRERDTAAATQSNPHRSGKATAPSHRCSSRSQHYSKKKATYRPTLKHKPTTKISSPAQNRPWATGRCKEPTKQQPPRGGVKIRAEKTESTATKTNEDVKQISDDVYKK